MSIGISPTASQSCEKNSLEMITVGFTLIGHGNWSGGEVYLRNMLGVIASELSGRVQAKLFLSPAQIDRVGSSLDRSLAAPPIIDERVAQFGRGRHAIGAMLSGIDRQAAKAMAREG